MKQAEIKVGVKYQGKSEQIRQVYDFPLRRKNLAHHEPYVLYTIESGPKKGTTGGMYLSSFAAWAKSEVKDG